MSELDRVNQLNRAFLVVFTEAMQSIKPSKEISRQKEKEPEKYSLQIEKME